MILKLFTFVMSQDTLEFAGSFARKTKEFSESMYYPVFREFIQCSDLQGFTDLFACIWCYNREMRICLFLGCVVL